MYKLRYFLLLAVVVLGSIAISALRLEHKQDIEPREPIDAVDAPSRKVLSSGNSGQPSHSEALTDTTSPKGWQLIDSRKNSSTTQELYAVEGFKHNVLVESSRPFGELVPDYIIANRLLFHTQAVGATIREIEKQLPEVRIVRTHSFSESHYAIAVEFDAQDLRQIDAVHMRIASLKYPPERISNDYLVVSSSINDPLANSSGAWGQAYSNQWGYHRINADQTIMADGNPPVIVAVVDSGIDFTHPELVNQIWSNSEEIPDNGIDDDNNGFVDDANGWDFYDGDPIPSDEMGHGTSVSGIVAARTNNHFGMAGAAHNAQILPLRCLSSTGYGTSSDVAAAVDYINYKHQAHIVNFSLGTSSKASTLDYALSRISSTVLVASAGNDGDFNIDQLPAGHESVIAVGSSNRHDQRSTFSNYGPQLDLVAPGENILSTLASNATSYSSIDTEGYFGQFTGTSMSAPFVAAAAAQIQYKNTEFSPQEIRNALLTSAKDLGIPGPDNEFGAGLLDIQQALEVRTPIEARLSLSTDTISGTQQATLHTNYLAGTSANIVLLNGEGSPVLTLYDAEIPSDGTISFYLNSSVYPDGIYTVRAILTDPDGFEYFEERNIIFSNTSPEMIPEWAKNTHRFSASFPTVADNEGDGIPEILYLSSGLLNWENYLGSQPNGWPVSLDLDFVGPAAIGDLDKDGEIEVFVFAASLGTPAFLIGLDAEGKPLPGFPIEGTWVLGGPNGNSVAPIFESTSPSIADINADGEDEVIFGLNSKVYALSRSGEPLDGWPVTIPNETFVCTTSIADINGDGLGNVTIRSTSGLIYIFDHQGNTLSGWPSLVPGTSADTMSLTWADFDADAQLELLCTEPGGTVSLLDREGNRLYTQTGLTNVRPPAVSDISGGAALEIALTTHAGVATILDNTLAPLAGWPQTFSESLQAPTLADLDGNGSVDILAMQGDSTLLAWNADGSFISERGFPFTPTLYASIYDHSPVTLGDFNVDGALDMVYAHTSVEMRSVPTEYEPTTIPFPTLYGNAQRISRVTPEPTFTHLSPQQIPSQAGVEVVIHGEGFLEGTEVLIDGVQQTVTSVSWNELNFTTSVALPPVLHDILVANYNTGHIVLEGGLLINNTNNLPIISINEDTEAVYSWDAIGLAVPDSTVGIASSNSLLLPSQSVIADSNQLQFIPSADLFGFSLIELDYISNGDTVEASFWVRVTADNDPPFFDPIEDIELPFSQVGVPYLTITGISAGPHNESDQALILEAKSSHPDLLADPVINYQPGAVVAHLPLIPSEIFDGEVSIEVTLRDTARGGNGDARTFTRTFKVTREIPLVIESVEPNRVTPGETLTIIGTGFSQNPDENAVYMGTIQSHVQAASSTVLVVTVPYGAITAPIKVQAKSLSATAKEWTQVIMPKTLELSADSFSNPVIFGESQYYNSFGWLTFDLGDADLDGRVDVISPKGDIYLSRSSKGQNSIAQFNSILLWSRYGYSDTFYNSYPGGIAAADLNADNALDVVTVNANSNGFLRIYANKNEDPILNDNDFSNPLSLTTRGNTIYDLAIGDLNADGRVDIVNGQGSSGIELFIANGNTDEISTNRYSNRLSFDHGWTYCYQPKVSDLNLDGKGDFAITASGGYTFIYGNEADVGSLPTTNDFTLVSIDTDSGYGFLQIADCDGDGWPDIIRKKEVLLNRWQGNWDAAMFQKVDLPLSSSENVLGQGDLNADGLPELIIGNADTNEVSILKNTSTIGHLSFTAIRGIDSVDLRQAHVGDLNADGVNDLVMSAYDGAYYHVRALLNLEDPAPLIVAPETVVAHGQGEAVSFEIEIWDNAVVSELLSVEITSDNSELIPESAIQIIGIGRKRQIIIQSSATVSTNSNLTLHVSDSSQTTTKQITVHHIAPDDQLSLVMDRGTTVPVGQIAQIPFSLLPENLNNQELILELRSSNENVIADSAITVNMNNGAPYIEIDGSQLSGSVNLTINATLGEQSTEATIAVLVHQANEQITVFSPAEVYTNNDNCLAIAIPVYSPEPIDLNTLGAFLDFQKLEAWDQGDLTLSWEGTTLLIEGCSSAPVTGTEILPLRFTGTDHLNDLFIRITIPDRNRAPSIDNVTSQSLFEDAPLQTLNLEIRDDSTALRDLEIFAFTTTPDLINSALINTKLVNNEVILEYGLIPNAFGQGELIIAASDGELTAYQTVAVNIEPINDAPTIDPISDYVVYTNQPIKIPLTGLSVGNDFESHTQNLTLELLAPESEQLPFPLPSIVWTGDSSEPVIVCHYIGNEHGTGKIRLRVFDDGESSNGGSNSIERSFNLTIRYAPVTVRAVEPPSAHPADTVLIHGSGFHPDPDMNVVRFGHMKASVIAASNNQLTCIVPNGAPSSSPIVVAAGLQAKSPQAFTPSFSGAGELIFSPEGYIELTPINNFGQLHLADWNNDERTDLVVIENKYSGASYTSGGHTWNFYRNESIASNASFISENSINILAGNYQHVDIDADGNLDWVGSYSNRYFSTTSTWIGLLQHSGNLANSFYTAYPTSSYMKNVSDLRNTKEYQSYILDDFNADNSLDLVRFSSTEGTTFYTNPGLWDKSELPELRFSKNIASTDNLLYSSLSEDFNGDGLPDLVRTGLPYPYTEGTGTTRIRLNSTPANSQSQISFDHLIELPFGSFSLHTHDINNDGRVDIILSGGFPAVLINNSTPNSFDHSSFTAIQLNHTTSNRDSGGNKIRGKMTFGDLNGDGLTDIVHRRHVFDYSRSSDEYFEIYLNTSTHSAVSFADPIFITSPILPIAIADIDGDSRPDIIGTYTDRMSYSVYETYPRVYLNQTPLASSISPEHTIELFENSETAWMSQIYFLPIKPEEMPSSTLTSTDPSILPISAVTWNTNRQMLEIDTSAISEGSAILSITETSTIAQETVKLSIRVLSESDQLYLPEIQDYSVHESDKTIRIPLRPIHIPEEMKPGNLSARTGNGEMVGTFTWHTSNSATLEISRNELEEECTEVSVYLESSDYANSAIEVFEIAVPQTLLAYLNEHSAIEDSYDSRYFHSSEYLLGNKIDDILAYSFSGNQTPQFQFDGQTISLEMKSAAPLLKTQLWQSTNLKDWHQVSESTAAIEHFDNGNCLYQFDFQENQTLFFKVSLGDTN